MQSKTKILVGGVAQVVEPTKLKFKPQEFKPQDCQNLFKVANSLFGQEALPNEKLYYLIRSHQDFIQCMIVDLYVYRQFGLRRKNPSRDV
jgi:hypothetical protein